MPWILVSQLFFHNGPVLGQIAHSPKEIYWKGVAVCVLKEMTLRLDVIVLRTERQFFYFKILKVCRFTK